VNYTAPGVYTVTMPAAGVGTGATAGTAGGASAAASAGIILGAAVLGGAAVESVGDDVPPDHPISR
jgi:hypothetical protein